MGAPEDEEKLLRSAAMQNAKSILLARRRAAQALARKTEELAHSLSLTRATLESTTDGILVTDEIGRVTDFNEKFMQMWRVPRERMDSGGHQQLQQFISQQVKEPDRFLATIREIYASWPSETSDLLEFMDGRLFERYSKIQRIGERNVGRVWSFRDITERKRAELQLHQQREWFRVTLSSVGDAVITTDTEGNITFLNPVAEMMTGWKSAEAAGQSLEKVFTIINEETREPAFNPVAKVLREGITVGLANHTALISRDGIETAIEDSAAPIKDATGRIIGVVMVFHDVSERRKTEVVLRISHAQFSAIINQSPVGICLVDDQLRLRHVNPKARPAFGSLGDLVGRDWVEVLHVLWPKAIADDIVERFRHTLKTGESYISPGFVADRADRKVKEYYDWQIHRVTLPEAEYGVVAYFTDTSAHVLAQQALRESEGRFRASFNQAAVGMAMAALNGRFEQVNQRMADILGYSPEELCERTFIEITHPEDKPQTQTEVRRLLAGEIPHFVLEKRYVRNDGRVVWSLTVVSLLKDPEGRPQRLIGVVEDITQRKQAEASVREAAERLAMAREAAEQANHAKDHFLAALSHELRTPLTPVLALLTNLCEQTSLPMAVIRDLETMRRNVELEARLIDDLLDLTRVTRGKLELHFTRTRISQVIEDAIATCLSDLKTRRLSLFREIDNPQKTILVDCARITQILWNLLKNSIKFTPEGGRIIIRSRVPTDGDANHVTIEVQDTGMGIEPENLHRVFEAFEQGDRKITRQFGGLGLGLAISKAIAESHNGTLTATSEGTGRGSTFKLTLPAEELEEAGMDSFRPSDEGKLSETVTAAARVEPSLRILLVEDHTDTAKSLSMLLERRGYIVSVAGDVASALKLAATQPFDLLLSDIGLPDATGYELMSQIRERHSIPGIALSGYGMEEDVRKCHEAGFSEHLVKPVRISQLEEALARIVPRR